MVMHIRVKLFASARELAGTESVDVELFGPATVGDVRRALMDRLPAARELVSRSMFAVDYDYVSDRTAVPPEAEIACIPPVSGG
jgi:molybdopterin synthase sulfur carrier subunit